MVRTEYNKDWARRNPNQKRLIDKRAIMRKPEYYRALKKFCQFNWRENLKHQVFGHYSNHTFKCACFGESEQDFLVIDHTINGQGNQHRRAIFGRVDAGGYKMHRWLVKNGLPEGFQLLCANCNTSKGKHGECIHKVPPMVPQKPIELDTAKVSANQT
jgi:hypothetical protein